MKRSEETKIGIREHMDMQYKISKFKQYILCPRENDFIEDLNSTMKSYNRLSHDILLTQNDIYDQIVLEEHFHTEHLKLSTQGYRVEKAKELENKEEKEIFINKRIKDGSKDGV